MLALGIYLGYPVCCVAAFCAGHYTHYTPEWVHRMEEMPLGGTGFIPCLRCANEKTAEELRAYIEAHRLSPHPFPGDDPATARYSHNFKDAYASGRLAEALHKAVKELTQPPEPVFGE